MSPAVPPTLARRIWCAMGAIGALAMGALALFALMVVDDETRAPGAFGGAVPTAAFVLVVLATSMTFGGLLGRALVPASVVGRQQGRRFEVAMGLGATALVLALPSPLALFSWPLAAAAAVASFVLFRRIRSNRQDARPRHETPGGV